jgi:hypothetical protein
MRIAVAAKKVFRMGSLPCGAFCWQRYQGRLGFNYHWDDADFAAAGSTIPGSEATAFTTAIAKIALLVEKQTMRTWRNR